MKKKKTTNKLSKFKSSREKIAGIGTYSGEPKDWISTGNLTINKIISGHYDRGIATGRMSLIAGPSSSGKSFLLGNMIKNAQDENFITLIIDTENAIDDRYMRAIGVDVNREDYIYNSVSKISVAKKLIVEFLKFYRSEGIEQPALIAIDSLDMMQTDAESEKYAKGEMTHDQGLQAKTLKKLLGDVVQDIKNLNVAVVCTKQVYKNQDQISSKREPYIITDAVKFAFHQIMTTSATLDKDKETLTFEGINMKVFCYKSRFCKPFQTTKITVPYDTGINKYSGMLEVALDAGIVKQAGAWYNYKDDKFQGKDSIPDNVMEEISNDIIALDSPNKEVHIELDENEIELKD